MAATSVCNRPLLGCNCHLQGPNLFRRRASRHYSVGSLQAYRGTGGAQQSNRNMLEIFYYGRAFAQTLSERVSTALQDLASELGKADAERRQSLREFQEEVVARARADMMNEGQTKPSSSAMTYDQGSLNGFNGRISEVVVPPPPDLEESVDELRAEIASTRSTLQLLKSRSNGSQPVARRL